ncbi:MAG TPA: VOC family protein [Solirubrobacteraceae bacterium]|nr:VOC family protein [Solirubrobacteraceae bacterium]
MHTVGVPVSDQDRALEFYLDMLGFEKRRDAPVEQLVVARTIWPGGRAARVRSG